MVMRWKDASAYGTLASTKQRRTTHAHDRDNSSERTNPSMPGTLKASLRTVRKDTHVPIVLQQRIRDPSIFHMSPLLDATLLPSHESLALRKSLASSHINLLVTCPRCTAHSSVCVVMSALQLCWHDMYHPTSCSRPARSRLHLATSTPALPLLTPSRTHIRHATLSQITARSILSVDHHFVEFRWKVQRCLQNCSAHTPHPALAAGLFYHDLSVDCAHYLHHESLPWICITLFMLQHACATSPRQGSRDTMQQSDTCTKFSHQLNPNLNVHRSALFLVDSVLCLANKIHLPNLHVTSSFIKHLHDTCSVLHHMF